MARRLTRAALAAPCSSAAIAALLVLAILAFAPLAQAVGIPAAAPVGADTAVADQPVPLEASPWKARLDLAARNLAPTTGDWVLRDAVPRITWLQIALSGMLLLVVAAVERSLRALMRRHIRRQAAKAGTRGSWLRHILEGVLAPVALLIWVWGACAAIAILLADLVGGSSPVLLALVWLARIGSLAALFWLIFRMITVVETRLEQWAAKTESKWDNILALLAGRTLRWIAPLATVILLLPTLHASAGTEVIMNRGTSVAMILAIGFILVQLANAVAEGMMREFPVDVQDNLAARRIRTQVVVLKKVAFVIIAILTLACALMAFPSVRHLGASLLASAGIAGIIVGFAAQRSLGTLVSGLQIALTQPIRIDDVVIVENEWGKIEEIALTYVVVRIWDLRRLVVPTSYFLEKPFQNWTRVSADLLGTVMLYVDYTAPLKAMREELDRILEQSKLWDHKVKVLQVTDATDRTLELRALVSAGNASAAWDLRCEVREAMVDFLQRNYPECLPRTRAEVETNLHRIERKTES